MVLPGVGTVVGGLVGSLVAGGGLGVLIDKATGKFFDSDTDKMIRLIQAAFRDVSEEYPPEPRRGREDIGQACG